MKYFFSLIMAVMLSLSLSSQEPGAAEKDRVQGLADNAIPVKGEYPLSVALASPLHAVKGVKALLYLPPLPVGKSYMELPVVIWYHGNSREDGAYRSFAGHWKRRAETSGFILLSVQNWWPMSGDNTGGAMDSAAASHAVVSRLMELKWTDGSRVFVTGFSAGGLTAFATFLRNIPDPFMPDDSKPKFYYRGVGVFKGNFYQDPVLEPPIASSMSDKSASIKMHMAARLVWLSVGGATDAPRVLAQMPELRNYIRKYLFADPVYQVYPGEGHVDSDASFQDFWKSVQKTLK